MNASQDLLALAGAFLSRHEIDTYVVGGAVRDRFLSSSSRRETCVGDIDLLVTSPIMDVVDQLAKESGAKTIVLDEERGFIRLLDPENDLIWLDIAESNGDVEGDLARRDFTINAMAVHISDWVSSSQESLSIDVVIDNHGGVRDIHQRVIRETVSGNLSVDPVRMFRAVRFATQFEFEIDPATANVISNNRKRLENSSPERVRDEFFNLMMTHRPEWGIRQLDHLGLLGILLPELTKGRDFVQPGMHYYDVMEHGLHSLEVGARLMDSNRRSHDPILRHVPWCGEFDNYFRGIVGNGQSRGTILKMVAMLHDIGKPGTMTQEPPSTKAPNGRTRFLGHGEYGAKMATDFLTRLRCSRQLISHVSVMIEEHLRPFQMSSGWDTPTDRAIFRYFRDVSPVALDTVMLSVCDYAATSGPLLNVVDFKRYSAMLSDILARGLEPESEPTAEDLLLNGHQVQERFGLHPGPEIGRLLGALRTGESLGAVRTKSEAYELLARLIGRAASRRGRP